MCKKISCHVNIEIQLTLSSKVLKHWVIYRFSNLLTQQHLGILSNSYFAKGMITIQQKNEMSTPLSKIIKVKRIVNCEQSKWVTLKQTHGLKLIRYKNMESVYHHQHQAHNHLYHNKLQLYRWHCPISVNYWIRILAIWHGHLLIDSRILSKLQEEQAIFFSITDLASIQ